LVGEDERQVVLDVVLRRLLPFPTGLVVLPSLLLLLPALKYFTATSVMGELRMGD
jgi:hypothetical protein